MKLYLDDDTAADLLVKLLIHAGHDVSTPIIAGKSGAPDPLQFAHATRESRVLLTHNYDDFKDLHTLVNVSGGNHPGVIVVRRDNDSARDLSYRGIVNAIRKLEESGTSIANEYIILNYWR